MPESLNKSNYYAELLRGKKQNFDPEKYADIIEATKEQDSSFRAAAYFVLGNILNHELLEQEPETFYKGYKAILDTRQDDNSGIRFSGVIILSKIMDKKLLELEEDLYMEGMQHLLWATHDMSDSVSQKATNTLELKREQLKGSSPI